MYWVQRRLHSQNFLTNRELVHKLIRDSSISSTDTVLEIGSGLGIITNELIQIARQVIAVELDTNLYSQLKSKFSNILNLRLIQSNFLDLPLPSTQYKVFSNIPFSITGEIVRKLLLSNNSPTDSYLVMQEEAANKFITSGSTNTMAAILYYPWFEVKAIHNFHRSDFSPRSKVDSCLIRITKRQTPLIPELSKPRYFDYVTYHFNRDKFAKYVPPSDWLKLYLQKNSPISGSFNRWQKEQQNLSKIHRTRNTKNWKNFKSV